MNYVTVKQTPNFRSIFKPLKIFKFRQLVFPVTHKINRINRRDFVSQSDEQSNKKQTVISSSKFTLPIFLGENGVTAAISVK